MVKCSIKYHIQIYPISQPMTHRQPEDHSTPTLDGTPVFFKHRGLEGFSSLALEEACHIIRHYFDYLEDSLTHPNQPVDVELLQEMLLGISLLLRSRQGQIQRDGYLRMLDRLTIIYAKGLQVKNDRAFARTAANFAGILESVSQSFQDYDYSHPIGLLIHYMDKLFTYREESWIEVLEHLRSMPDSIRIIQELRIRHLQEIERWVEEGVDNLFTLFNEQREVVSTIDHELEALDGAVSRCGKRLAWLHRRGLQRGVVELARIREAGKHRELQYKRRKLQTERNDKQEIVDLLDCNLREFTGLLAEMRRSALIKLVWRRPQP